VPFAARFCSFLRLPFTIGGVPRAILQLSSARAFGGGERHLTELCRALAARGFRVHVAHRPSAGWLSNLAPEVTRHELPLRNALDIASAARLARILREREIDILHAHLARDYPVAALAARLSGRAALAVTRHVMFPLNRLHAVTLRRAARVVAVSGAVREQLLARKLAPPDKIRVIHNGTDLARFDATDKAARRAAFCARRGLNPSSLLVGMLGDLRPLKGPDDFLRAAARIAAQRDEVAFLVAGPDSSRDGADRRRLENLASELGLAGKVCFTGWLDDAAEFYAALDVFVSASHTESFGLTLIEAMAAAAPVVATRTAGALEIVTDCHDGRLTAIGAPDELAAVVSDLLAHAPERARLAAQGRATARERFSLERMATETAQLYEEIMAQR
jgi:glycosyltransferase involved in cell wall biosynthesis